MASLMWSKAGKVCKNICRAAPVNCSGGGVDVVDRHCVDFSMVIRSGQHETSNHIQVVGHVDLDEEGRSWLPVLVCDGEGDVCSSSVLFVACQSG